MLNGKRGLGTDLRRITVLTLCRGVSQWASVRPSQICPRSVAGPFFKRNWPPAHVHYLESMAIPEWGLIPAHRYVRQQYGVLGIAGME